MSKSGFDSAWLEHFNERRQRRTDEAKVGVKVSDSESCQRAEALATDSFRKTQGSRCPHVRFTLCRVKLLDVDAKYASTKDLLDGLAIAGIIRGDKEGQITLEVNQVKVSCYKDEQTIIEVEI